MLSSSLVSETLVIYAMPKEVIIYPLDLPVPLWEQARVFLESVAGGHLKA